jgi:AraC-like DNA-binding protein
LEGSGASSAQSFQRLVPGINAAIIVQLVGGVDVQIGERAWQSRPLAFAEGHFHEPFTLRFPGRFRLAGISFAAGRIHRFIRDSQARINNRFVDLSDVFGPAGRALTERIEPRATFDEIAGAFDAFLLTLPSGRADERGLYHAMRLAVRDPLTVTVKDLADVAGLSARQLERRFLDTAGMSPKYFCRVARFDHFMKLCNAKPDLRLAHLAHECGYFDQSHLNRDFKWFAGETPTAYLHRDRAVPAAICRLHLEVATRRDQVST